MHVHVCPSLSRAKLLRPSVFPFAMGSACDNLRCTACNFSVLFFDGMAWDASTDYIFLRNTMPNREKLATRLRHCPDMCAYACQCSWKTVEGICRVPPASDPRWVCGGH
ncbi:unnamed protein product [Discosporangium mesarthrocarpum]